MSEFQNSNHSALTEDQKDYCYEFLRFFQEIADDLKNADMLMHQGKFFDAMDFIRTCNSKSQIGTVRVKEFVQNLQKDNKWS